MPDKSQYVVPIEQGREIECFHHQGKLGKKEPHANTSSSGLSPGAAILVPIPMALFGHTGFAPEMVQLGKKRRPGVMSNRSYTQSHEHCSLTAWAEFQQVS